MDENEVIGEMNENEEAEPELLTCPVCGEEVEPGTENCPLCGAPVGALENNAISGTSIDNSAAIDAMLQSAAMLVEESASLGVSLDDYNDDDEEDEAAEETAFAPEPEEEDPVEPVAAAAMPTDLTADQKSQIEAGGIVNLSAASPPSPPPEAPAPKKPAKKKTNPKSKPKSKPKPKQKPSPKPKPGSKPKPKQEPASDPTLYEMDESGNAVSDAEDREEAPYTAPAQKSARHRQKRSSPVLVVAAVIVALAFGCAVGFFGKTMFFPDVVLPECQDFARRAVTDVNSVVDGDMYITEAYVLERSDATQCIFRAAVCKEDDTAQLRWFRVKVYSDAPDTVRIYFQLDMDRYNAMMDSDDEELHIQASMLMNNQQELERCISEVQRGATAWKTANAALLNDALHPIG